MPRFLPLLFLALAFGAAMAAPPRTVPPRGLVLDEEIRRELEERSAKLERDIDELRAGLAKKPEALALLPDVQVFHKAAHWAVAYDELFQTNDIESVRDMLRYGEIRLRELRVGKPSWINATGLVVRGYASRIDGSIQPYGLVVPAGYRHGMRSRLDVWLHGRDNNLTELRFIRGRLKSAGEFTPPNTLVLHPYGRYCNAFKFAGETDVFEALDHVRVHYAVDDDRRAIRGFSMGGAGCWHLAAHHAGFWAAAAPGAGFAETADYTRILTRQPDLPWYEQTLWNLYDATAYAPNLAHCPTIAYSGELDKQKQAADVMSRAMADVPLELPHIIGPGTAHKYEPGAKVELNRRFDALMQKGRDRHPDHVHLTTWTLRYHEMFWVSVEGLERHWKRADIDARILADESVTVTTTNITAFTLRLASTVENASVDGETLKVRRRSGDSRAAVRFQRSGGRWRIGADRALAKRPGLQGPIDDAFMDSFLFVRPTGVSADRTTDDWILRQLSRATNEWRAQFRGDAPVKNDVDVTAHDIENCNLVLWGDPESNRLLAALADKLPIKWPFKRGSKKLSVTSHVPVLIYPNPLNRRRYVVLNSGFTFWQAGEGSNALQTPKLPDWALMQIDPANVASASAQVIAAGFFDEQWRMEKGSAPR